MPDIHHAANYVIGAVALLGVGALGARSSNSVDSVASVKAEVESVAGAEYPALTTDQIESLAASLESMPKHDFIVYCMTDCGAFPKSVVKAFRKAHWKAHIERVL